MQYLGDCFQLHFFDHILCDAFLQDIQLINGKVRKISINAQMIHMIGTSQGEVERGVWRGNSSATHYGLIRFEINENLDAL